MIILSATSTGLSGTVKITGSKSISNRVLVLNHLLKLNIRLLNISDSEDTRLLLEALQMISRSTNATINVNHAGSDMRFLTALLAVTPGEWILTGSERLKQRPLNELVIALKQLGADISWLSEKGHPPVKIAGGILSGGAIEINAGVSSQFISALLLIAAKMKNGLTLSLSGSTVSRPYINMTLKVLQQFGVTATFTGNKITVPPVADLRPPASYNIESDWSSASYWFSFCALSQKCGITLTEFQNESLQGDAALAGLYRPLGVETTLAGGKLVLKKSPINAGFGFDADFTHCPDIAMTLAVTCFGLGINATLRGLKTLRLKESDRILALKTELEKLGATVIVDGDTIRLSGKPRADSGKHLIETYHDHRIAMSFAPLCMRVPGLCFAHPEVVDKSYPTFWEDLKSVGISVHSHP